MWRKDRPPPQRRGLFRESRLALPVSLAVHAAVLYVAWLTPWTPDPASMPAADPPPPIVWLAEWPRAASPVDDQRSPAEPEPAAKEGSTSSAIERPAAEVEPAVEPAVEPQEPRTAEHESPAPTSPVSEPSVRPRMRVAPNVDWEAERRRAAGSVIEQQTRDTQARSFSYDDLPENERAPKAPTPPTPIAEAIDDPCVIAEGKFERFAARMIGRCVREARGDLFADIEPGYLKKRPVCVDTRDPDADPLLADVDRDSKYSTVKCKLVDPTEP